MNIADLKEGDTVAAQCGSCCLNHVWKLVGSVNPAKVTMQRGYDTKGCTCVRQTTDASMVQCVLSEVVV